jgi:hypothetical protein
MQELGQKCLGQGHFRKAFNQNQPPAPRDTRWPCAGSEEYNIIQQDLSKSR